MSFINDVKKGFKTKPIQTCWRLLTLPMVATAAVVFAFSLVVFNLGFDEAKRFMSETF
ncbi:TPA: hypothetical protein VGT19_005445 [Vibrio harveyi]|nr:hypothetical protein [Vibrio harveyi]